MKRMGGTLSRGLTMPIAAAGASSIKMAMDFEKSLAEARAQADLTSKQVSFIGDAAKETAKRTGESTGEIVEAYKFAMSAGKSLAESQSIVKAAAEASAAGFGTQRDLVRTTTTALEVYSDSLDSGREFMDLLVGSAQSMELEVNKLSGAMKRNVSTANNLGIGLNELLAGIGAVSEVMGDADRGGRAMAAMLNNLMSPSGEAKTAIEGVYGSLTDMRIALKEDGLLSVMNTLRSELEATSEEGLGLIFSQQGLEAALNLTNREGERMNELMGKTNNTLGSTKSAFDAVSDSAANRFRKALQTLKVTGIELGSKMLPIVNKITEAVSKAADWFGNLSDKAQYMTIAISGIVAAIGPLLIMLGSISAAIGAISLPVVGVIAAFGALSGAILYIVDNWEAFKERFSDLSWWRNAIIDMVQFMIEYSPISAMIKGMNKLVTYFGGDPIPNPFEGVADKLDDLKTDTKEYEHGFGSFNKAIKNGFSEALNWLTSKIEDVGTKTDAVKQKFKDLQAEAMKAMNNGQMISLPEQDMSVGSGVATEKQMKLTFDSSGLDTYTDAVEEVGDITAIALRKSGEEWESFTERMHSQSGKAKRIALTVSRGMNDMTGQFLEGVGKMMAGTESFGGVMNGILTSLADLAVRVGKIAIGVAWAIEGIKKALESLNPVVAFAAGAALIAVGSAAKSALSNAADKGGSDGDSGGGNIPRMAEGGIIPSGYSNDTYPAMLSSGERVVPPKKLDSVGGASEAKMERAFGRALSKARLKASGSDLQLVLNNVGSTTR